MLSNRRSEERLSSLHVWLHVVLIIWKCSKCVAICIGIKNRFSRASVATCAISMVFGRYDMQSFEKLHHMDKQIWTSKIARRCWRKEVVGHSLETCPSWMNFKWNWRRSRNFSEDKYSWITAVLLWNFQAGANRVGWLSIVHLDVPTLPLLKLRRTAHAQTCCPWRRWWCVARKFSAFLDQKNQKKQWTGNWCNG